MSIVIDYTNGYNISSSGNDGLTIDDIVFKDSTISSTASLMEFFIDTDLNETGYEGYTFHGGPTSSGNVRLWVNGGANETAFKLNTSNTYSAVLQRSDRLWFIMNEHSGNHPVLFYNYGNGAAAHIDLGVRHADARVRITDNAGNLFYAFPRSTPSSGDVLTASDGTGTLTWAAAAGGAESINELSDGYLVDANLGLGTGALNSNTTGAFNIGLGNFTLSANTTASCNISIGTSSLLALNGGFGANIGIGTSALGALGTGNSNVAIGHQSMANPQGCTKWNTAVGYQTLTSAGEKSGNTAVGMWALCSATTGSSNTGLGCRALQNVTTGYGNVGIGIGNGAITTGTANVAIGNNAAASCTAGSYNVAIGFNANSRMMPLSCNNIAIGSYAHGCEFVGCSNCNIAIGYQSMRWRCGNNSNDNIGIGQYALYCAAFSVDQIGIGKNALRYSKTGSNNVAVGTSALSSIDTATGFCNNTVVGNSAGAVTTGSDNTFMGYLAGTATTSGYQNVFLGTRAGCTNTTGFFNTAIGSDADVSGVAAGVAIGKSASVTGSAGIAIGWLESSAACEIRVGGCTGITYTIGCTGGTNKKTTSTATSVTLNPKTHNAYHVTTSGNTTFSLTAPGSSDVVTSFTVIVTAGGAHTLSWPASVKWAGGTAPDAPASGETDVYTLMTVDNGTTWYGFLAGDAMA